MAQLFANNAAGALAGSVNGAATTLTLTTGKGALFPSPTGGDYFYATLIGLDANGLENAWEIVKCTARSTDQLTVVRGQEGTTATSWNAGVRVELRWTAAGIAGKLSDAPSDGKTYGRKDASWIEAGGGGVAVYEYNSRADLRGLTPTQGEIAVVKGLGLFAWESGSTEPDDDESCFATATGKWLLESPSWDFVDAQMPEPPQVYYGSTANTITIVGATTVVSVVVSVPGALVGATAAVSPPALLPDRVSCHAIVTAPGTVTIQVTNHSAASSNPLPSGDWTVAVFSSI